VDRARDDAEAGSLRWFTNIDEQDAASRDLSGDLVDREGFDAAPGRRDHRRRGRCGHVLLLYERPAVVAILPGAVGAVPRR